jgi:diacylglycerol O-acyltransferase / wax synthase
MDRQTDTGDRLSPMEALMWRLEGDRALSTAFGSITFFDREPDPERLRARIGAAVEAIPRLRHRIAAPPRPHAGHRWVPVDDFSLDDHLSWRACPGPGDDEDALTAAARLVAQPFDPDAPPWNFVVLTGLTGGRSALIQRMHHAITDGTGGIRLSERFVDLERDPPPPPPDPFVGDDDSTPARPLFDRVIDQTARRVSGAARTTTGAGRWLVGGLTDPRRFVTLGADTANLVGSLRRQLAVVERARSPLWTARSDDRRMVVATIPFAPIRTATRHVGVSINDLFVTATLRAAARYHQAFDQPVSELRVAIPVSTRRDQLAAGNAFSPTRVLLPTGSNLDAMDHLRAVSETLDQTKTERVTQLVEPVAMVAGATPAPLLHAVVRHQAATIDYAASNVRAAPFPLFIAGAKIDATYAIGPLTGTAVNITMLTYDGNIDLGLHADAAAITDPELLRDLVLEAFEELVSTAMNQPAQERAGTA